jgi:NADPH:quinone reductase
MPMQAVLYRSYGGPEVLQLEERPIPEPGPAELRMRVQAAPVMFFDICNRRGDFAARDYYAQDSVFPITPSFQGSGVVEAVGSEVKRFREGDRVVWSWGAGSYAPYVVIPEKRLISVPDDIDMEQVAGGLIQGFLAYKVTHEAYPLAPGEWCLVQAAAGGVGSLICQMAKLRGAQVIGVTSTREKAKIAMAAGADHVVVSTEADVPQEVKRITGGGVRVVYDGVGKDAFEMNLDSLATRGYLIIFGQASGFVPPFDLTVLRDKGGLYLHRYSVEHYFTDWPDWDYVDRLFTWMRSGEVSVRIDRRYPLTEVAAAHTAVERRQAAGRVLLIPS